MSHRLTFGTVKGPCGQATNLLPDDPRLLSMVNRACEQLLYKGKWVGTTVRYVVCVNEGCLTWPRDIETIEAAAICSRPLTIRNGWFEFLEAGLGVLDERLSCRNLVADRGDAVAFDDVRGTGKKIAVYCDGTESGEILLRYWDANGQKFYSDTEEGERITLPGAGQYTYTSREVMPGGLYGVIKPITKKVVRLWEYTVAGGALKPLAYYEPDETLPVYRRSLIPALNQSAGGGDCTTSKVTIVGKLRFIPAVNDNSYLPIQHAEAVVKACQSVFKSDANLPNEAARYMYGTQDPSDGQMRDGAVPLLEEQLKHWQGDGVVAPIRMVGMDTWGMVQNVI